MKAADFVKKKDDKKAKPSEVKGKKASLIDWIGKRRGATKPMAKKAEDEDDEE
jgi:hypothetical protein